MSSFNLDDYMTVAERLTEFRERSPNGRILTQIQELPPAFADKFIAVKALVWRGEDPTHQGLDPDGTGLAWEPVPGPTSFVRDSELMNAETAAVGRALINALVADSKKGIASRDEVRNRRAASDKGGVASVGRTPSARRESGAAQTSDAGEGKPEGEAGGPSPASAHQHEWEAAPNPSAAERGYMVCKVCRVSQKDPV